MLVEKLDFFKFYTEFQKEQLSNCIRPVLSILVIGFLNVGIIICVSKQTLKENRQIYIS